MMTLKMTLLKRMIGSHAGAAPGDAADPAACAGAAPACKHWRARTRKYARAHSAA